MKYLSAVCVFTLALFLSLTAQGRTTLKYQVLVEDAQGAPLVSAPVNFEVAVRQGSASGDILFVEKISTETSPVGVAYFTIGDQSENVTLDDLDWAGEVFFLDLKVDKGTGLQSLGCSQIMSVPKAIHADMAGAVILTSPSGKRFKVSIDDNGDIHTQPAD